MPYQLPAECLDEIFEYLKEDKFTLHSCLLVNRLWCKISVRILWRNIWKFYQFDVASKILNTLTACLPNESKELLYKNEILISTLNFRPPLFNYVEFCKVLHICEICHMIDCALKEDIESSNNNNNNSSSGSGTSPLSLKDKNCLVTKEIIKMFMTQISSLKKLIYYSNNYDYISFSNYFTKERVCLTNLSELCCSSDIKSEYFYKLSQICHNLQSLTINFRNNISNELKELISLQKNLKNLKLLAYKGNDWTNIIPNLTKYSMNTLTKLHIHGRNNNNNDKLVPLSFISLFKNLQEIKISFSIGTHFEDFKKLQYITFPRLKILKIPYQCPKPEYVIKFLEYNGKNLLEFHIDENNNELNLSISKYCPNLKNLFIIFNNDELNILKTIFNNCKYLESIEICCGNTLLCEKEVLEVVANYSPKNFCELKIYNCSPSKLSPEDLEAFFINWQNRKSKKLLNIIIIKDYYNSLEVNKDNMEIIKKYINLGVIKFETKNFGDDELEGIY